MNIRYRFQEAAHISPLKPWKHVQALLEDTTIYVKRQLLSD